MSIPVFTELDAQRIRELGARLAQEGLKAGALDELVERVTGEADIVPGAQVAPDVVTVNSQVTLMDLATDLQHTVTIVYPRDFSVADRRISILSPVGRAVLGRRVGDVVAIEVPGGTSRHVRILALHFQPEAFGRMDL